MLEAESDAGLEAAAGDLGDVGADEELGGEVLGAGDLEADLGDELGGEELGAEEEDEGVLLAEPG